MSCHPNDVSFDSESSTAIFPILQEAFSNVIRHAEATRVQVRLEKENGYVVLCGEYNGKAISRDRIYDPRSFGLIGIREWAGFLGGEVRLSGSAGKGTTLTVRLPARTGHSNSCRQSPAERVL